LPETINLRGAVSLSHHFLRDRIREGDRVVDATCGNGHDTLLLAQLVGDSGKVWAFDIQKEALQNTRKLLVDAGCMDRVEIVDAGHENLARIVDTSLAGVVFNLGYLPGNNKNVTTMPDQTIPALQQAASLLQPGGVICVCIYTGHEGGGAEGEAVENWASSLNGDQFSAWVCRQPNRTLTAPYLLLVEKR
jgi:ubiquinone/menaquinone biosynthesis C-methylase UbiE